MEPLDGSMDFGWTEREVVGDDGDRRPLAMRVATKLQGHHDVLGLQIHTAILYSRFANSEYLFQKEGSLYGNRFEYLVSDKDNERLDGITKPSSFYQHRASAPASAGLVLCAAAGIAGTAFEEYLFLHAVVSPIGSAQ